MEFQVAENDARDRGPESVFGLLKLMDQQIIKKAVFKQARLIVYDPVIQTFFFF